MLRLFDFECVSCGYINEELVEPSTENSVCPRCASQSLKVIGISTVHATNEDAPWLRTVLEVVDKDSKAPHVREFLKNPTRSNYRKWMKGEGIRPLEPGEKPTVRGTSLDESMLVKKTWEIYKKSSAIEL